ncbi:MAG: hypothetical protein M1833_007339 [Piccolia ochrophora]|nr:MAG: hypothetical protein M1833_007339 [Piccolia ochrophora]
MQFTTATVVAILAAIPATIAAPLDATPLETRNIIPGLNIWAIGPNGGDAWITEHWVDNVISACNGKFSIGGISCQKTAKIICYNLLFGKAHVFLIAKAHQAPYEFQAIAYLTLAKQNGSSGRQPVYIDSATGALRYVALNAQVPAGQTANIWSTANNLVSFVKNATPLTVVLDFVACGTPSSGGSDGWQIFAKVAGFRGCPVDTHPLQLSKNGCPDGGIYPSY